jgi:hypothetical protein
MPNKWQQWFRDAVEEEHVFQGQEKLKYDLLKQWELSNTYMANEQWAEVGAIFVNMAYMVREHLEGPTVDVDRMIEAEDAIE